MDENIFDKDIDSLDEIKPIDLRKTMENSYIDYAMSVIASRALPGCERWFEVWYSAVFSMR